MRRLFFLSAIFMFFLPNPFFAEKNLEEVDYKNKSETIDSAEIHPVADCRAPDGLAVCDSMNNNVAMHFDGDGDYIQAANSPVQGSVDFTIEAWFFNQDDDGIFGCSSNFERIIGCGGDRFELGTCGTQLAVVVNSGSASIPGTTILNDHWYHVAATRSGDEVKVYLDCEDVYSTTQNFSLDNIFRVGRWAGGSAGDGELWKGLIDEVRVWDHARTPAEIEAAKNCELTGMETGLQLYYNFSEGNPEDDNTALTAATDFSPNGNDGTLHGFALTGNTSNYVCGQLQLCDPCTANFSWDTANACGGVQFTDLSTGDNLSHCWDFDNDPATCESTDPNPIYTFPTPGTHTACLTVSNPSGCEKTFCQDVIVFFDQSPPTITCPNDVTIECDILPSNIDPVVTNSPCATFLDVNCSRSDGQPMNSPYPPCQTVTVTCGASNDFGGNVCQFDVTTVDNTPPVAFCETNLTVQMNDCTASIDPGDVDDGSFDNCGIVSLSLDIDVFGPANACQTVDVTLTVTDCAGNTDQCVTSVFLQDTTDPILTCPGNVQVDCDIDPSNTGMPTASDPCPGLLNFDFNDDTLGVFPCDAIVTRTWIVADACGNFSTCDQTILVADQTPPVVTCPPDVTVIAPNATDPTSTGQATATDNCDPSPTVTFNDVVNGTEPCPKTITRTWTAEDDCFQIDQCVQVISVECDTVNVCGSCPSGATVGTNLVPNGDFENGNVPANFNFNSDYDYIATGLIDDGDYGVRHSQNLVNGAWSALDHTAGVPLGFFLACDGSNDTTEYCYTNTVAVTPGTEYVFCAFANNLVEPGGGHALPNVEVFINGTLVASTILLETPDLWQVLTSPWTATTGSAFIQIRSASPQATGNDFALDDISLVACAPTNPCDSLDFSWSFNNATPPLGNCCWDVSLVQEFNNPSVKAVLIDNVQGAGISVFPNGGWTVGSVFSQYDLMPPGGGPIAPGTYNDQFTVCFENITTVPQQLDLFWLMTDPSNPDSCVWVCPETIFSDCPISTDTCCTDFEAFCDRVNAGFNWGIDPDSCKLTVHLNDFSDCMEVTEWVWGDGPAVPAQPNPDGSFCHYYAEGGTYTLCYLAVERDETGDICWEKEYCETIAFQCTDTCALDTFFIRTGYDYANQQLFAGNGTPDPYWTINGQPMLTRPVVTNQTIAGTRWIQPSFPTQFTTWNVDYSFCLPDDQVNCQALSFNLNIRSDNSVTGVLLNGNPLTANWAQTLNTFNTAAPFNFTWTPTAADCSLFNSGTNVLTFVLQNVRYGTGLNVGGFITHVPGTAYTPWDIDCCPPAPVCPCDSLQADVDAGINGPKLNITNCYGGVRPFGLSDCDSISWTLNGSYVGSTIGGQSIGMNFQSAGQHTICMEVFRQQPNGVACGPLTNCKTVSVDCGGIGTFPWPCEDPVIANPGFDLGATMDGLVSDLPGFEGWEVAYGEPYIKAEAGCENDAYLLLDGNSAGGSAIHQQVDLVQGWQYALRGCKGFSDYDHLPEGTEIVVRLSEQPQLGPVCEGECEEVLRTTCCGGGIDWDEPDWPIPAGLGSSPWLTVHVENPMSGSTEDELSVVSLDNLCLTGQPGAVHSAAFAGLASIYPNPASHGLTIDFGKTTSEGLYLRLTDLWGRPLQQHRLPAGTDRHLLDLGALPPAVYFIELKNEEGHFWRERFVKQ